MSAGRFAESVVEQAALAWFEAEGYAVEHGAEIAPGEVQGERDDYHQVVLPRRLHEALEHLNHNLPPDVLTKPFAKLHATNPPRSFPITDLSTG